MNDEDDHSVTVQLPKRRIQNISTLKLPCDTIPSKKPQSEKRVRKSSTCSVTKYSVPGNKPIQLNNLERNILFLPYSKYLKIQNRNRKKQLSTINIKDKYKIISANFQHRLHTDTPLDNIVCVTDTNKEYFKYVDGRPLTHRIPLFKSIKYVFNDYLRIIQDIAYRYDTIINIETNYKKQLQEYDTCVKKCMDQANYYDRFIWDDYQRSIAQLEKWDRLKDLVDRKVAELQNFAAEEYQIRSRLIGLEYKYSLQQMYGRFLYYLSPTTWRSHNREFARSVEIEAKGFDLGNTTDNDTFTVIFIKLQAECLRYVKPVIYFTSPSDIMDVFNAIETQQLNHFEHVNHLAPHAKMINKGIRSLKDTIAQDTAAVHQAIKCLKLFLESCEERCYELKAKFFIVINGTFYESVGAPEVLKLNLHLEFCYEKVYDAKPMNMDMLTIAKAIEHFYLHYSKLLEAEHTDTVNKAISHYLQSEKEKARRAKVAVKELHYFNRLERELCLAYAPIVKDRNTYLPPVKQRRSRIHMKVRVDARHSKSKVHESFQEELTEAEIDYLTIFTDWTPNEDPAKYLQKTGDEDRKE